MVKVFWVGFPGPSGGANTECYHTAKLLRANGVNVTFLPTEGADKSYAAKLEAIGCKIHPDWKAYKRPEQIAGVAGSIVISMCNSFFSAWSHKYRAIGCKIIWVNCMTFLFLGERKHMERHGPYEAYVFQSMWQRLQLEPQLQRYGYDSSHGHLIRGAFDIGEFPFNPKPRNGSPFTVGRLSRAEHDKYHRDTWHIFRRLKKAVPEARGRVMAWEGARLLHWCGKPPEWVDGLASCAETSQGFLGSLHALIQANGGAGENWPRVGLEAMAAGVPVIAENAWGWREMVKDGVTGCLCNKPWELADKAAELACDEPKRQGIIEAAREAVAKLSDPLPIWAGWERMFKGLGA